MTTSRSDRARALATLDAWLAATHPVTGHIRPGDPDYWPPPVAIRDCCPPQPERVTAAERPAKAFRRAYRATQRLAATQHARPYSPPSTAHKTAPRPKTQKPKRRALETAIPTMNGKTARAPLTHWFKRKDRE